MPLSFGTETNDLSKSSKGDFEVRIVLFMLRFRLLFVSTRFLRRTELDTRRTESSRSQGISRIFFFSPRKKFWHFAILNIHFCSGKYSSMWIYEMFKAWGVFFLWLYSVVYCANVSKNFNERSIRQRYDISPQRLLCLLNLNLTASVLWIQIQLNKGCCHIDKVEIKQRDQFNSIWTASFFLKKGVYFCLFEMLLF